jgi:hypothetical protein
MDIPKFVARRSALSCVHGVLALCAALVLASAAIADEPGFQVGDIYLLATGYTPSQDAIVRIDPLTGDYQMAAVFAWGTARTFTYDSYRNRLVYVAMASRGGLRAMDAAGTITQLAPDLTSPTLVAARGDGLLYLWYTSGVGLSYLDADGVVHDLLDEAGTGRFTLGPGTKLDEMIYDAVTNSLIGFVGDYTGGYPAECPQADRSCAVKIPLTADGGQVAAAVAAVQVDVSPSFEMPVGSGHMTGGGVFWVVDTNSNDAEPRLQQLDPVTMNATPFASNGPYAGAASTTAGTYSSARGQGVVPHPVAADLRAFSLGEVGSGDSFAAGILPAGCAPLRMVEIHCAPMSAVDQPSPSAHLTPTLEVGSVNPLQSEVLLRFSLPTAAQATLTIHDVRGRRIRSLASGTFASGFHDVTWNGRAEDGRLAAAGLYIGTLESCAHVISRKLIVLR